MIQKKTYSTLRLILGDQLNSNHSWFKNKNEEVLYVMMELVQEQEYVTHHIQKISAFFLAMRSFAEDLTRNGYTVKYITITDNEAKQTFKENLICLATEYCCSTIEYQTPDEYRLQEQLSLLSTSFEGKVTEIDTEHFYTSKYELKDFFSTKKSYLLETFYRYLRKKHHILIEVDETPRGGNWNYDKENRNKLPQQHQIIELKSFKNDISQILKDIKKTNIKSFGNIPPQHQLHWPVNRKQSLEVLDNFLENGLPFFGVYQDALTLRSWRVYHSLLSFSLNSKLISPKEVMDKSITYWETKKETISISQIEGFVRQILGWREYVRGIYWLKMPEYTNQNYLNNSNSLPLYFWNGETNMQCLKSSIGQSLDYSYAHHIQRLMVIGNFALLAGCNPTEVDKWYLGVYADAIEWVQLPNTRGMSQFADGGVVATKPYISSSNYIHNMSDYCSSCFYKQKETLGDKGCPFNSLYWNFIDQHRDKFESNRRMKMMYTVWDKKQDKAAILQKAEQVLTTLEIL